MVCVPECVAVWVSVNVLPVSDCRCSFRTYVLSAGPQRLIFDMPLALIVIWYVSPCCIQRL